MTWVAILIGCATFFALALGGADHEFAHSAIGAIYTGAAAIILAFPQSRDAAVNALWRHRFAVIGLVILLIYTASASGGLGSRGFSSAPYASSIEGWAFLTMGFAAIAAAGGADAAGRNRLLTVLLATPIVLALAILADQVDGVGDFFGLISEPRIHRGVTGPFATRDELGVVFTLFILLGAFAAMDEIRRRPIPGAYGFPPLSRRLMLPAGSVLFSLNVLAVSGARGAMVAAVVGVLVMWALMTVRLGAKSQGQPIPAYAAGLALAVTLGLIALQPTFELLFASTGDIRPYHYLSELVARASSERPWLGWGFGAFPTVAADMASPDAVLSGFHTASSDLAVWRVEAGVMGIALGLGVLIAFLWPLGLLKDRGRRPSRGLALCLGVLVVCFISGIGQSVLSNAAIAHLGALLFGLATAFVDDARPRSSGADAQGMPINL